LRLCGQTADTQRKQDSNKSHSRALWDCGANMLRNQHLIRESYDEEKLSANLEKLYMQLWNPVEESFSSEIRRDLAGKGFLPLGVTQEERDKLTKAFQRWQWDVYPLANKSATKKALLQVHSPNILHIATHGLFAALEKVITKANEGQPLSVQWSAIRSKYFENPML
jgi:hypothetical protein